MQELAAIVVDELELRLRSIQAVAAERKLRREAHRIAMSLQTEMLPQSFPVIQSVVFDALYSPAATEAVVGGDWYDAVVLESGQLLLSIGDVAGHGLHAAVLMGKLRQSLRTIALSYSSPGEILRRLDRVLRAEDPEMMVTAFVALLDLRDRSMIYANAGHPPPLLRLPSGEIVSLSNVGLPLGLRDEAETATRYGPIPRGSVLVLYTDGLTESARDLLQGEASLHEALADPNISLGKHPAFALRDGLVKEPAPDDVAILTLTFA